MVGCLFLSSLFFVPSRLLRAVVQSALPSDEYLTLAQFVTSQSAACCNPRRQKERHAGEGKDEFIKQIKNEFCSCCRLCVPSIYSSLCVMYALV